MQMKFIMRTTSRRLLHTSEPYIARGRLRCLAALLTLFLVGTPAAFARKSGFWIEPRTESSVMNKQMLDLVSEQAGFLGIRIAAASRPADYYQSLFVRLKEHLPQTDILINTWVTRYPEQGKSEKYLLEGADLGEPIAQSRVANGGTVNFLDMASPQARNNIAGSIVKRAVPTGADGLIIDLAIRTPRTQPKPVSQVCSAQTRYCEAYGEGVEALFADLRSRLGPRYRIFFNGLFNSYDGQVADQGRLLKYADGATIEYFGLNPNQQEHAFRKDILPYLQGILAAPKDKLIAVFGRGSWSYTDYVADYAWQRYLFASFLLAAREQDLFKYHATFQVPTNKGRSGGLDYYADWKLALGPAQGAFVYAGGIYQRHFANGLVAVAPDDGRGGGLNLDRVYFTPEGQRMQGEYALGPGQGLILLTRSPESRPVRQVIGARAIAAWRWANSQLDDGTDAAVHLLPLSDKPPGEHDLLLDYERSLTPFRQLGLSIRAESPGAEALAIAEVDDPRREKMWLVVRLGPSGAVPATLESVDFRSPARKNGPALWPVVQAGVLPGQRVTSVTLDGPRIAASAGLVFRRWSHMRLSGPLRLREVELTSPATLEEGLKQ
jgi:hypothetical protein